MKDDDYGLRTWSVNAIKDWYWAFLINLPLPIVILATATFFYRNGDPVQFWGGALAAGFMALAFGTYFAGRQSMVFTRVIDGAYMLALFQAWPLLQFGALTCGIAFWNFASQWMGKTDSAFLKAYAITLVALQVLLLACLVLGVFYRKPRGYPRWLRPWNHDFDRDNDTLTRRWEETVRWTERKPSNWDDDR